MKYGKATIGSIVSIKNANEFESYLIVEDGQDDPFTHRVSVSSPIGKSLIDKQRYDFVNIVFPGDSQTFVVTNVFTSPLLTARLTH